jgi:hypothetical protein
MTSKSDTESGAVAIALRLFLAREGGDEEGAFRVHIDPRFVPPYLARSFDRHFEAYPVYLDRTELERQMTRHGVTYAELVSVHGDVALSATGRAAHVIGEWLATSLASGMRGTDG